MPVWVRLSIAGAATLLVGMGIGRFSYSPMIPALIEAGQLSVAQAGNIGASNFLGYLAGATAAPLLRRRWGEAASLRICLVIALLCLAASILPWGFMWLAFWRFLVGCCVGVMMIYVLAIVTRHAPPARLGAATGIVFTGVGIGILFAATLVPLLLQWGLAASWAGVALVGAAGVCVAFWGWRAAGSDEAAPGPGPAAMAGRIAWTPAVIGLVGARTLFSLGLIPHSIYWVDYLVRGLGRDIAFGGMHWALFGIGAITGTFLWGRLADRIGFRAGLVLVFAALALGVAMPVMHSAGWALVLSSLVVGAQPGFSALIAGRTHQLMGPDNMAAVWRRMSLISGIMQGVAGYAYVALHAYSGSYTPIFLAGGTAMALGARRIHLAATRR
ncbi:MAG: YbfB/YjiJ family MFS transporter [Alphaproteobacteria bacterium]